MNELRLLFARSGDAVTYRITTSWGVESGAPQPFVPFLGEDEFEDLRWYLEEYMDLPMGGAEVRARRVEGSLVDWGHKLFAAVFEGGDHRDLYNELLDRRDGPRLLTVGTKDLEILRLPWELIADGKGPLSRRGVTLRRQLETAGRLERYETGKLPLRILLAVSRPDDTGFLDPRHTTRAMLEALAPLGEGVVVDFCRPATLDTMERMLAAADRDGRAYHIVHFDGHGTFLPKSQIGALCFEKEEDAEGKVMGDRVYADRFGDMLATHRIPLVILEACRSGTVGRGGVAPRLIEAGVGSVLSMSHAVHVEATKILLRRFYEELVAGATIGQAVEHGRGALVDEPARWMERGTGGKTVALEDWFLPNLYQGGEDLALVPGGAENAPRSTTTTTIRREPATGEAAGAFPLAPMYEFDGRAWELQRLERRFLSHRAVVLHAMGGMGKTSLAREVAFWGSRTGMFPDGACFVSFEQAGGAARAVQVLGNYFEGAAFERRSAEEQKTRARELFHTKKVLVVWDNFESVLPAFQEGDGVAALYPEEERAEIYETFAEWTADKKGEGRLLVTCRPGDAGLGEEVCTVELHGLAQADALSLLHKVMQKAGAKASHEREAFVELLEAVEMHPLSIELVGPHLKSMGPAEIVRDFQGLLDGFTGEAAEGRNRSLRASIGFSLTRLSERAREAVRWLGLFSGGVFEDNLLDVSQIDPAAWSKAREELEATALLRVEQAITLARRPYLRFHPTLAAAADGPEDAGLRDRYVGVYEDLWAAIHKALHGANPRWGMEVMAREEGNFRKAVIWSLGAGSDDQASAMGDILAKYLLMTGRRREREQWLTWLADEVYKHGFSKAAAEREMDEAEVLSDQGEPRMAIEKFEALAHRLRMTTAFDPTFVLGLVCARLGRLYGEVGHSPKAVPVLMDSVRQWESLIEKAQAVGEHALKERGNLAAALGDLANVLCDTGMLDEALAAAERSSAISRERGDHRSIAAGLGRIAQILATQGRFAEADTRYDEVIQAAELMGDRELQGIALQHQGALAGETGQFDRAAELYKRSIHLFQETHNKIGVMQLCNRLGVIERKAGRFAEAREWYECSREVAVARGDQDAIGAATQNLGIVCQEEGEVALTQGDDEKAREHFTDAARLVGQSSAVWREHRNEPNEAASHCQLGQIYLLLGDLDKAQGHAHHARQMHERLGLKEAHLTYQVLAAIARARGPGYDAEAAAWEQKRDALLTDLRHRAGALALPQQIIQVITQLALACAHAGRENTPLGVAEEESITTLSTYPAPLDTLAPFLRALAAGDLPSLPPSLPSELTAPLTQILDAVQQAKA